MFNKILIANRGEIACRIIRTAQRLGIRTVAVYSEADASARHVALADEAVAIGPASASLSYLDIGNIIEAAERTNAEAIHPGYGFLAENEGFAEACVASKITFVGPAPEAIRLMGSKSAAKSAMERAGVPVVPGYHGVDQADATLLKEAKRIGWPVLIKASSGGGGKGMRIVAGEKEFGDALASARREAQAAFGDSQVLLEKYLLRPRHIEFQIFCDNLGNAVHLFERDCSVQRRHQKVLEEAPAPRLDKQCREQMGSLALTTARVIEYVGAGTVEFIMDEDGSFYFMEMNTRLQVEHPVTELITGQDLVEWQLRIASGEALPLSQEQLSISGHAMEARLYAEDPERDFLPATGLLAHLRFPEDGAHIRVDTGVREGDQVTMLYDPMIAKLIVWDRDRGSCLGRMLGALNATRIIGVTTNLDFLASVVAHEDFQQAHIDTRFIERHHDDLFAQGTGLDETILGLGALFLLARQAENARQTARRSREPNSSWYLADGWRANLPEPQVLKFMAGEEEHPVAALHSGGAYILNIGSRRYDAAGHLDDDGNLVAHLDGKRLHCTVVDQAGRLTLLLGRHSHILKVVDELARSADVTAAAGSLTSPMPGRVVHVNVKAGQKVKGGDPLMIIEAMKMEHTVTAPADGTVSAVHYQMGDMIEEGAELLVLKA